MKQGCIVHIVHVAGTRMIAQGTDGLSRGDLGEGIMKGNKVMLDFVPLHLSAIERSPLLKDWINSWFIVPESSRLVHLTPEGWFEAGHDIIGGEKNADNIWIPNYKPGHFVWAPAPAAGQAAIEQLRQARLKRQDSTHLVVIPNLLAPRWRKHLFKAADLVIEMPFDETVWKKEEQHEPLTIALFFPFLSVSPWQLKRSEGFGRLGRFLRSVFKESEVSSGDILFKLLTYTRKLPGMSKGVVRAMLCPKRLRSQLLHSKARKRPGSDLGQEERRQQIFKRS
jgi:hypothetical protein